MSAIAWKGRTRPPKQPRVQAGPDGTMPLLAHILELRDRMVKSAIGVALTTILAFIFIDKIIDIIIDLAGGHTIQALDPTETFGTYFKVALSAGIGMAMPILVYQLLRFLSPGLSKGEKRALYLSLPFIALCFITGALFCYYFILPSALDFLLGFGDPRIQKNISLTKFVGFVTNFILAVGASFETPVIVFMLAKLGIVTHRKLGKFRKYAFLLAFLIAAIITPTPDPFNQTLVGAPLYLLYELGVQLSRFARKTPRKI